MKVLIVYAHPEPLSLNGSLKDFAVSVLSEKQQNSGDYDEQQVLKPELENGATGLAIHQQTPALNFAPQQIPNKGELK